MIAKLGRVYMRGTTMILTDNISQEKIALEGSPDEVRTFLRECLDVLDTPEHPRTEGTQLELF